LLKKRIVDLSEPIFQNADERFDVGKLEVAKHLAGVRISGILLNTSSVGHKQLTMSVSVAGRTKEFTVNSIRPGYAAKFSVYVPDVKAEDARFAEFEFVRSTVSYHLE